MAAYPRARTHEASSVWLRNAALGSGDAIVLIASLVVGVAAASAARETVVAVGIAGLISGAISIAIGEYSAVRTARRETQLDLTLVASPIQAPGTGALGFAMFAMIPIVGLVAAPPAWGIPASAASSICSLAALGAWRGYVDREPVARASLRLALGGAAAMALTATIGCLLSIAMV